MKLVEIRQDSEFQSLRCAWDALVCQSRVSIFLTWEWTAAWWSVYGTPDDLRILTAWDENGALRGIAPLRTRTLSRYGQTIRELSFIGDGSNDSDYLDFILAEGYEEESLAAFREHLAQELRTGTILQLNEIQDHSPSLPLLKRLASEEKALWLETDVPCATVPLPQDWEEYLAQLKPRFRTKIRSVLRNLEGRQDVTFGFCENAEELAQLLPKLFDLHGRRWAKDGKPGVFGWDLKREFYSRVSPLLLERGWLRLSWLKWNEQVLASQYGFVYRNIYFQLQEGYEPAAEQLNLGLGLRAWSIRKFQQQGVREYDFLGGAKRNKLDWGAEIKQSKQILIASDTWKNRFVCRGPEWEKRAREKVSQVLPQKILSARTAWLKRGSAAGAHNGERIRNAAASCYFHSRLPALMRPLRDRYQLSLRQNSTRRRWERRGQPSARILYYHRVNDDRDPFFPAISTTLFEREMRYISKHYKVVSVSDLLNRLNGAASEPVLAITFDDGYEDNYLNAFPILQRYQLPATIFLTTGSLDSRQPLWFEELATALKRTEREFVDLEIDFPRRFFLRTQDERLQSNDEIFALLRRMRNCERNERLAEILHALSAPIAGERTNKMLTWDQVRLMNAQQIEFGGHTVTHPFLSRLTRAEVTWEVSECKQRIEAETQGPVHYFAYPNGREEDFGDWNKDILRTAGYKAAMTTIWGLNYATTDLMELRRGGPWEENVAQFAYKLDWYQWVND